MAEHVIIPVDNTIHSDIAQGHIWKSLWVNNFAKVIEAVEFVPYVELNKVLVRTRNWESRRWKQFRLFF
jgi:hypothetical protein